GIELAPKIVDIVVCNNRYMGGGMLVAPDARIDDGELDLVIISSARRLRLMRTFPKIYSGGHVHDPIVRVERTCGVELRAGEGGSEQGVALDGELVGTTPARFEVLAGALAVRC